MRLFSTKKRKLRYIKKKKKNVKGGYYVYKWC